MTGLVQVPSFHGYTGATLHLNIDQAEHQRRQNTGTMHGTGHGFGGLDHLMALPAGLPVPLKELTPAQQKYVRSAPTGILTVDDGHVTRHVIRPCRVALATVRSRHATKLSLDSASRFAPFCNRTVIIERHHPRMDGNLFEFSFYGIGVDLQHPDGTTENLVPARPWKPMRHTPAGWWFAERAYAAYLTHTLTSVKESR